MYSPNSSIQNAWLHAYSLSLKRYCLVALLLLMAWVPQAFAFSTQCEIFVNPPGSATVAPSGTQSFSVILQDVANAGCSPTNLNFSTVSDTTGGVSLPATITAATFSGTGTVYNFNVTAGSTGGGSAVIQVNCTTCLNGALFVQFTLNTTNVFTFTPTTPTSITTNQSTPFTLGTNLLVNGSPGTGYQINFQTLPSGPSLGSSVADGAGNASVTTTLFTSGTRNIEAQVVCPMVLLVPGCPPAPVAFTVVVEPVVLTAVSTNTPTFSAGGNTTMIARYGGTISVVNPGYLVTWAITASPAGGNGVLSGITTTNGAGQSQAGFTATVPGNYTVVASTGDTWSGDPTETYTITVTAIVRTLAVSSGNGQSAPTSTSLPSPLVALAQDNGVNASGITINWAVVSGSATVTAPTSVTGVGGLASMTVNLGPTPGPIVITGTRADNAAAVATFNITSTLTRTLVIVSGNGQNATPGSPLASPLVVDARNNGIGTNGVTINWTITVGSTLGVASNVTAGGGVASNTVTVSSTPGLVTITATRQDDPAVFVSFTANGVTLAGIPGLKPNQQRIAGALDTICTNLNLLNSPTPAQQDFIERCQELADNAAANPGDVIKALDELLPDAQAAQARAAMLTASRQFENINARIAALRSGTQGSSFGGLALTGPNGSISLGSLINGLSATENANTEVGSDFQRWGFFASGTIGSGDSQDAGVTPSFDFNIHGLTLGVDYRQSDKFIFGAAIGYTNQNTDLAPGQGGVDASGYTLSAYGTYFRSNSWYTDGVITFGKNNYDLERQISYTIPDGLGGFTTVNQTARSDSGGDLMSLGATFGRDFQKGGWSIGPYGRVLYTRMNFDRIQETLVNSGPGAGLALIVEERTLDSLASVLGGKFTRAISTNWGVLTPHFQLEWEHEFNSDQGAATARFVNDPTGTEIILTDAPYDSDYFRIGVGLSAIMSKGRSGFLYYDKTLGRDGVSQDNLALGFRLEF